MIQFFLDIIAKKLGVIMSEIKKLEELLNNDVLIEVKDNIKEIEDALQSKAKNKDLLEELKYMKEVKKYFDEVLIDIEKGLLSKKDAIDILEGLNDMRVDNQEV